MLPVLFYCAAIFTLLLLYFFYKPSDELNEGAVTSNEMKALESLDLAYDSSGFVDDLAFSSDSKLLKRNVTVKKSFEHSEYSISADDASLLDETLAPSSSLSSSIGALFAKLTFLYRFYILNPLLPLFKYLGLNHNLRRQVDVNLSSTHFISHGASSNQIEDVYKLD
jgi:hypothetical protein